MNTSQIKQDIIQTQEEINKLFNILQDKYRKDIKFIVTNNEHSRHKIVIKGVTK